MLDSMIMWYLRKTHFATWDRISRSMRISMKMLVIELKWCQASGILCELMVPLKLKGKFYRIVIRPTMLYRIEC
jgi:hypothetical protein